MASCAPVCLRTARASQRPSHIDADIPSRIRSSQLAKTKMLVEGDRPGIEGAHAEMNARGLRRSKGIHHLLEHAPPVAATMCTRQQIYVQVRRIGLIWLGAEVVGVMID